MNLLIVTIPSTYQTLKWVCTVLKACLHYFMSFFQPWHYLHLELGISFVMGGCSVHCKMFTSLLGLNPLDANRIIPPSSLNNQKSLQMCPQGSKITLHWKLLTYSALVIFEIGDHFILQMEKLRLRHVALPRVTLN